jgi:hypothetical protein
MASRQAGYARTFKEIQAVVADAAQKDIAKCYKFLLTDVKEKVEMITPASLVRRYCSALGLGLREVKAAEEMARTAVPSEDSARCGAACCSSKTIWGAIHDISTTAPYYSSASSGDFSHGNCSDCGFLLQA